MCIENRREPKVTESRFTINDLNLLKLKINRARFRRKKLVMSGICTVLAGMIFGVLFLAASVHSDTAANLSRICFAASLIGLFIGFYGIISNKTIKRIKADISYGYKLTGESGIVQHHTLRKKVVLADGTTIDESTIQADSIAIGDVLKYEKTLSGEHVLKCEKIAERIIAE